MDDIPAIFWIAALLILVLSIVWHEFCHYLAAKIVGMRIKSVHVGLPFAPLLSSRIFGVCVTWSPYLIGGGVKIEDESYEQSSWWRRTLVAISGPVGNIILAIVALGLMFGLDRAVEIGRAFTMASVTATGYVISLQVPPEYFVGPIGLVRFMAWVINTNPAMGVVFCIVVLNTALAVTNMIPLPALDGGLILSAVLGEIVCRVVPKKRAVVLKWEGRFRTGTYYVLLVGVLALLVKDALVLLFERMGW